MSIRKKTDNIKEDFEDDQFDFDEFDDIEDPKGPDYQDDYDEEDEKEAESDELSEDDDSSDDSISEKTSAGEIAFVVIKTFLLPIILIAGLLAGTLYVNQFQIVMSIPDEMELHLEYGDNTGVPEVTAAFCGRYFLKNGFQLKVEQTGKADLTRLGEYDITYNTTFRRETKTAQIHVIVEDTTAPDIQLTADPKHYTRPIDSYEEEGFTAMDAYDGDLTDKVTREESKEEIIYRVSDSSGNEAVVHRTIVYKDVEAPVITLKGKDKIYLEQGGKFEEPGFTADDDCEGDLTKKVRVLGMVDPMVAGDYTLTYVAEDAYHNVTQLVRTICVRDTTAPSISLSGDKKMSIELGKSYKEPGFSAKDSVDGNLTASVSVKGSVDTSKAGSYKLTYTVKDAAGNKASAERTVTVFEKKKTEDPGSKIIYLTFDDGPGKYTSDLLDVLDRYGVKATFFVTNQYPAYQDLIAEEARRGHTVAIHTYSHDYATVYASEDAYYKDLKKMSDVIENQTGKKPTILRFPGGSSNAVSKKYCSGIMTSLTKSVQANGYTYFDWNVTSGDAGETTEASGVYKNVIAGVQKHDVSVVLQHDIKKFSVDAVADIIEWGQANGYTFLPLSTSSPTVHHGLNN